ncbi:MAG: hypothetical protein ACRDTG_31190 [Pseudonocardiaceae bacterium]
MRVEFALEVFTRDGPMPPIVKVLECVAEGRHDWSADPPTLDAAESYFNIHAPKMSATYLELGRKGLVGAAWQPSSATALVHVMLSDLADVAEDLCRPAVLVVEDLNSDGFFVHAIAQVFRADRILEALSQGWLVIRHAGGEPLVTVAQADRCTFRREVRVVALLDSDRWLPQQRTRAHDKADDLRKSGILVHVLELREAENYVPNRVLSATIARPRDAQRKLKYVKRLTLVQRGYYDMKYGFRRRNGTIAVRNEQQELFHSLEEETMRALAEGFGRNLLSKLKQNCASLTVDDFAKLGPGVVAELRELLLMINKVV